MAAFSLFPGLPWRAWFLTFAHPQHLATTYRMNLAYRGDPMAKLKRATSGRGLLT